LDSCTFCREKEKRERREEEEGEKKKKKERRNVRFWEREQLLTEKRERKKTIRRGFEKVHKTRERTPHG